MLRSDSPASETGTVSDDKPATKGKAKSRTKINGAPLVLVLDHFTLGLDEAEFDLKRKRVGLFSSSQRTS